LEKNASRRVIFAFRKRLFWIFVVAIIAIVIVLISLWIDLHWSIAIQVYQVKASLD
jgi:hypothetical protein